MTRIQPKLGLDDRGPQVVNLQDCLLFLLSKKAGLFGFQIPSTDEAEALAAKIKGEQTGASFLDATVEAVGRFQKANQLDSSGVVNDRTASVLNSFLKELGAFDQPVDGPPPYTVEGTVTSPDRAGIGGLKVLIVDKSAGPDVQLAEATTDERGRYTSSFPAASMPRGKTQPDLQVCVQVNGTVLARSEVRYNASNRETLDVRLPANATALPSEYETLIGALAGHFTGRLGDLKEDNERQDITYLANKTGWDARAVAMAALADQFSQQSTAGADTGIPAAFFYALFRAGLPADGDALYHTGAETVVSVWKQAIDQGVIPSAMGPQVHGAIKAFQKIGSEKLLTGPALVGVSSVKEMINVSGMADGDPRQQQFADLYAANRADMPKFWEAVTAAFGADTSSRLQVDGKLGFLTVNNAPLMQKVHATLGSNGLSNPLQLAQAGYHRAEMWSQLLTEDVPIPRTIPGDTPESKRANYAEYLGAQVRISYPTAAVAQMVKSGELPLTGAANGVSDQVHTFLTEHQGKFEIGVQPVQQYITQNNLRVANETVQQVKRLQRVYQITPSDQALTGLMKRGIDAAYHVVRYDKETFVQNFAADLGGADHAVLTYDKSVQIHSAVLNIALSYLNARTAPAIGVHSPPSVLDPAPANAGDIIASATLETLFGSMDFCACDHCRSILSPAAYLVDLLLFLDQPNPPAGKENPQTILLQRRPDIQYLPLTCENTNTALPYIDVVNETLEYFIANNSQKLSLKDYHGYDTNGATSEDLLANPQFVMDSAYMTLRDERFPAPLPFHQPIENLRRYFNKFEVPLPSAMERFRKNNDLERGANPYGWRDILMEEITLSRGEYEILTDSTAVSLWRMYGFPNGTADTEVIADLSNAKQFARRVGITYEDMVSVLETRFINPNSDLIPKLERLGVNFAMLAELKTRNDAPTDGKFDALLAALAVPPDPAEYGGDIKTWVKGNANYVRIKGLITLAIPAGSWAASKAYVIGDCAGPTAVQSESTLYYECTTAGTSAAVEPTWPSIPGNTFSDGTVVWTCRDVSSCLSFDNLAFRYFDPAKITQDVSAVEMARLLRFIRLWKKLGWTIKQADAAICALYPSPLPPEIFADTINTVAKLDAGFLTLLPHLGIVIRVIRALNLAVKRDLPSLLACWSEIGTHGDSALYRQMFLNPALLEQDAVFNDNGYGEFLTDTTKKLADHAGALRSAFNLTGDEYDRIVVALGYDAYTALTIPNVSAIYRRGWLARKMKLSVRELLLLIQLTGLDPFAVPDPTNPAILRLVELVQWMKDRSLKSASALYLIWNQDLSGKSAPDPAQIAALASTLRRGFAAVETEFTVADDPDGAVAQTRMALIYGADGASFFCGLLNDTLNVEVGVGDVEGAFAPGAGRQAIENAGGKTDSGIPRIAYDDFRKRLSYSGVLTMATRDAIKLAAGTGAAGFKTAVDNLYDKNQTAINPFFARYPELQPSYNVYIADTTHSAAEKRSTLLKTILPELVLRRKRQQALQAMSTEANTDLAFTQTLLDPPTAPFPLHAARQAGQSALNDLLALETPGLSVEFFANDTANGAVIPSSDVTSNLDYGPPHGGIANPLPANPTQGAAISGIWRGYLEAPESGFFNLRIEADAGAAVTLVLAGSTVILIPNETLWTNADALELRAGTLYSMNLTVEKVRDVVRMQWDWKPKGQGRAVVPARYLYPAVLFDAFKEAYIHFLKAASLTTGLGLSAKELTYFATHADYRINPQGQIDTNGQGWLNALPNADNLHNIDPAAAAAAKNLNAALLTPLQALLEFARIKAEISRGDESLLAVLKDPTTAAKNFDSLLFIITRWNSTMLNEVLVRFSGDVAGLGHFDRLRRVYDAFALIAKMGISAKALIQATTNEPTSDTVRDLQAALRARYAAEDWREVVRPINDEMRSLQRDALVAYILHQMRSDPTSAHIDTADKLFEYFLMDVQMDPCMRTSRIRHALSSVQLFIERCLMNLEPRVSSAAIDTKQWAWMKRYRVWEANRKVYLFPENWLEPELRDDKSPFFKEIESELLQSDITEDSTTTALLNYLSKLEEVAKLEPCGFYFVPGDQTNPTKRKGEIDHVIARTAGAHRKYYYRRYDSGNWTPWEQIKLGIEDNPVIPVVWKDRLLLFWLRILKQPTPPSAPPSGKLQDVSVTVQAILCWSEYYNGKWQAAKTSDVNTPTTLFSKVGQSAFDPSQHLMSASKENDGLRIIVAWSTGTFLVYNTHSLPVREEDAPIDWKAISVPPDGLDRFVNPISGVLSCDYQSTQSKLTRVVLNNVQGVLSGRAIQPCNPQENPWTAPFFYEDSRHVFYVTTTEQEVHIFDHQGYGIAVNPGFSEVVEIPPLVLKLDGRVQVGPKLWGDGGPVGPSPGMIDQAPIQRFVTEDAYIRQAIGTTGAVMYSGKNIGPSGAIRDVRSMK